MFAHGRPQQTSPPKEIHELGSAMKLAQRAIWSFAHFVPKELVQRVIDNSISTELGGVREEITVVFTDVRDFTTIAESADPDILMHQTSRYFSVLTEAFLAEGGTIDKFIGDAVMCSGTHPIHSLTTSSEPAGQLSRADWRAKSSTPSLKLRV
jgi:adenylate cyclase